MNFEQLPDISVGRLMHKINQHPELWAQITARQDTPGSPHKDTESIVLRWAEDQSISAVFNDVRAVDYPAAEVLMPEVGRVMQALMHGIDPEQKLMLGRVLIVKLKPGGCITPHMDEGYYADFYDRFHVVLSSARGSAFVVGNEKRAFNQGEAFWFNHKREHTAVNDSSEDRIHLIADVRSPKHRALRGIYFQREEFAPCYEDALPLLQQHYTEIATHKDIPLSPRYDMYKAIEAAGLLRIYTARHNGELVGYSAYTVGPAMHYETSLQAQQDVLYVAEEYRGKSVGIRLLKHAEQRLRAEGVQLVHQHVKLAHPMLGKLLMHSGYEASETIYTKRLD